MDYAYIRVSSRSQDYGIQRDAIARELPPGASLARIYEEKQSAKTLSRPELQQLLADARMGTLGPDPRLYVFKLDRLCRTGVADTFQVLGQLRQAGVAVHAVADNLVVRPSHDDLVSETIVFALSLAARLERTAINDRIAAARTRMEAAGEPWGRPPRVTSAQKETAVRMRAEGRTVRQISAALGVPRATVGRLVKEVSTHPACATLGQGT